MKEVSGLVVCCCCCGGNWKEVSLLCVPELLLFALVDALVLVVVPEVLFEPEVALVAGLINHVLLEFAFGSTTTGLCLLSSKIMK